MSDGFQSPLQSPDDTYDDVAPSTPRSPSLDHNTTRTVAIIKNSALEHRFDIEARIQEARFEIVKERQMEFDVETDPETLYELFGEDTDSLAEGPVWVYVLERRRAVEVWTTLMGHRNPEVARHEAPKSLRALYGTSSHQNAVMGSPDTQTAEIQIAALFASSPPFPTSDLPDDRYGSMRSVSSSILSALRKTTSDEGYAPSSATNPSTAGGSKLSANGKPTFRARPLPATHTTPDIQPRSTRAALLRAGVAPEKVPITPRAPPTKEQLAKTFANVPGHKRAESIAVASTAAPTIVPRMTRAASLRLGQQPEPSPIRRRPSLDVNVFEGVPGHKRRESISVASTKAPALAPRLNKSAALRTQKDNAPPSSFMFKAATEPKVPAGLSRSNSRTSMTSKQPASRPASQASSNASPVRRTPSRIAISAPRPSSAIPPPALQTPKPATNGATTNGNGHVAAPAARPKPRPSSISAPTIAPRTNRSAVLRAAKKEAEAKPAGKRALVA